MRTVAELAAMLAAEAYAWVVRHLHFGEIAADKMPPPQRQVELDRMVDALVKRS